MISFPHEQEHDSSYSLYQRDASSLLAQVMHQEFVILFPTPLRPMTFGEPHVESLPGSTQHQAGLTPETVMDDTPSPPAPAGNQRPPPIVTDPHINNSDEWSNTSSTLLVNEESDHHGTDSLYKTRNETFVCLPQASTTNLS
jgi:hypothetical protein